MSPFIQDLQICNFWHLRTCFQINSDRSWEITLSAIAPCGSNLSITAGQVTAPNCSVVRRECDHNFHDLVYKSDHSLLQHNHY
ncbi:MAG: hypothetical protein KME30_12875 [Iphinoe sp. HA4291-MV1]|nr:hypothetical protein [Iphinoe sp. HA4291-MV1]